MPLQGHITPMLQLASILYTKGFSITIIHTQFNPPNPSNYPCFAFHSIPDGLLESEANTSDVIRLLTLMNVNCITPFRDTIDIILDFLNEAVWTRDETIGLELTWAHNLFVVGFKISYSGLFSAERLKTTFILSSSLTVFSLFFWTPSSSQTSAIYS